MPYRSLTGVAHQRLAPHIKPGDLAIDATAGNGHDTLFLARAVAPSGQVWAFDLQSAALEATRARLRAAELDARVELIEAGHEQLAAHLPAEAHGQVRAIMFNLGYLPGGDHGLITRPATTLAALNAALSMLAPGGQISLLIYRAHDGGAEEAQAIERWLDTAPLRIERIQVPRPLAHTPLLVMASLR